MSTAPSPSSAQAPASPSPPSPPTNSTQPPTSPSSNNTTPSPPSPPPSASPPPPPPPAESPPPAQSPPSPPPSPVPSAPSPGKSGSPPPPPAKSSPPPPSNTSTPGTPVALAPPPPSTSNGKSRSPPRGSSTPSSNSNSSSGGISATTIIAIAVGGAVVLIALLVLIACCAKKKKRRYYPEYPGRTPAQRDDYSDGRLQYEQRRPPLPPNNFVKVPPAPSPPNIHSDPNSAPSSASFHGALPPPPPPPFSSGEDPSSNFQGQKQQLPPPSPLLGPSRTMFTYGELSSATNGFSQSNLLGQGGFGCVYKGILANGQSVAVKQLKAGSGQGEREFQAEVEIISRVHHRHLVSLIGYCMTGSQRLLVYEFVSNNTLDYHLHTSGLPTMPWATRLKIAVGAARGLAYLHEDCYPKIIHRDIKSSNILLDSTFEAKVADFGLAKIASEDFTHVSTRVMGTFGYLAPEYAASGKLTEKSDVFSFGVVLLEMITGRKPVDTTQSYVEDSLVEWARPLLLRALEDGNPEPLVDPRLGNDYDREQMMRLVACAASSVRHSARKRPRMGQILRVLEGDVSLDDLHRGVRPGHSTMYSSFGSSDYDTAQYGEDMKKFRKMAFASQEYTSEYSGLTSRGQQLPSGSSSETMSSRETDPPNRSAGFHRRTYISSPEDHKTTKGRLDSDEFP